MWNSIKNFFQKNKDKGVGVERKTMTYTVITSITYDTEGSWLKNVRTIRKILKETIGKYPDMKVLKIDSK